MGKMDQGLTKPKWVLIKIGRKYPKCPKIYLPKLSVQGQKFGILINKRLHWASVVWLVASMNFSIFLLGPLLHVGSIKLWPVQITIKELPKKPHFEDPTSIDLNQSLGPKTLICIPKAYFINKALIMSQGVIQLLCGQNFAIF